MLAGLLECSCGRLIRSDGRMGNTERVAKLHTDPCAGWGTKARISASTWEVPVMTQLGSLRLDNSVRAQIVAVLSAGEQPVSMAATTTQLVWMLAGRLPETHSGERRSPTRTSRGEQGDFERTSKRRIDRAP
jgi:hypothetical protein